MGTAFAWRGEVVNRAWMFACDAHKQKKRRHSSAPPLDKHVAEVATLLQCAGYFETHLTVALLHETVEKGGATLKKIREVFGHEVAAAVNCLTDKPAWHNLDPLERKKRQARRLRRRWNKIACVVRLADLTCNLRSMAKDDNCDPQWVAAYARGGSMLAEVCRRASESLYLSFLLALANVEDADMRKNSA